MDKKELQKMAPELLAALEALYSAYAEARHAERDYPDSEWSPERDEDMAALEAKRLINLAKQ